MNIKKLEEQAKYYEKLTRQYREAADFLQALRFNDCQPTEYSVGNSKSFENCNEISIQTPAILEHKNSRTETFYKVNLIKDLGMEYTNQAITEYLIEQVKLRMAKILSELQSVFDN